MLKKYRFVWRSYGIEQETDSMMDLVIIYVMIIKYRILFVHDSLKWEDGFIEY